MSRRTVATAIAAAALVATLAVPAPASAAVNSSAMTVSSTVAASATMSTSPLSFGSYTGAQTAATALISINATNGTSYMVGVDAGSAPGATTSNRRMTGQTASGTPQYLNYGLYQDAARTTFWGNTQSTSVMGISTGSTQNLMAYGVIPANQNAPVGNYTDTLTVTVSY